MNGEDLLIYSVPLVVFLVSLFLCFFFGKTRFKGGLITMGLLWLCFTVAMLLGLRETTGWDGLGYLLALIGLSAPAGVGALLGGLVGWFKKENTVDA